jgi:hypothetical protein
MTLPRWRARILRPGVSAAQKAHGFGADGRARR